MAELHLDRSAASLSTLREHHDPQSTLLRRRCQTLHLQTHVGPAGLACHRSGPQQKAHPAPGFASQLQTPQRTLLHPLKPRQTGPHSPATQHLFAGPQRVRRRSRTQHDQSPRIAAARHSRRRIKPPVRIDHHHRSRHGHSGSQPQGQARRPVPRLPQQLYQRPGRQAPLGQQGIELRHARPTGWSQRATGGLLQVLQTAIQLGNDRLPVRQRPRRILGRACRRRERNRRGKCFCSVHGQTTIPGGQPTPYSGCFAASCGANCEARQAARLQFG
jgi:hypothetical protein